MTRMVVDLGLGDHVVGRTPWCAAVDGSVPTVGRLDDADFEALLRVRPTHLLIQPSAGGMHPELRRLAERHGWTTFEQRLNTIDDIERAMAGIAAALGEGLAEAERALLPGALERWRTALRDVLPARSNDTVRARVLLTMPGDPALVFGRSTYLHDIIERLGFENAANVEGWASLSLEDLARLDPEVLVIVRANAPMDEAPLALAGPLGSLPIRAVYEGRIIILRHPEAVLPSSAIVEVAREVREAMARVLESGR